MTAGAGRIALVAGTPAGPGSAQSSDLRNLRRGGWDVRLFEPAACWRRGPRLGAGLALTRAAARRPAAAWRSLRDPGGTNRVWCRRQLAGRLVALRPRLVHFDSARSAAAWLAIADALGAAMVVTLVAEDLYASGAEPFEGCGEVWRRADALVFPDRALEHRALRRGCPADVGRAVVPPAVEEMYFTAEREPSARPPGKLRIVSVDALEWMQGFEHAIHAVRLLRDAGVDCEYTIVGDGEYLAALAFARHQLGVVDRVQFSGPVPPGELRDILRSADVFLDASVVDGLPRTVLQALACGTPAVMSDPGSLGETALDGAAAFIVPRRSPEALAEKLATLAADEDLRLEMGRAARAWATEHASCARRLAGLEGLYHRVLASAQ